MGISDMRILVMTLMIIPIVIIFEQRSLGAPDKIILRTGEARTIELPNAVRVHVTRKGIIHLVSDHDDYWSITALRSGVVAIETRLKTGDTETVYVDVRPRAEKSGKAIAAENIKNAKAKDRCLEPITDSTQFETHATVELVDDSALASSGIDSRVLLKWNPQTSGTEFDITIDPKSSRLNRHIIGDPIVTARPCQDLVIRAGGEDEFESRSDQGHIVSTWKSHGLDIKMKLVPTSDTRLVVPFSVALRTPSKGQGSYALSNVESEISLPLGKKTLAAVINLSSSSTTIKEQPWLAHVPIIGPLFTRSEDSKSTSRLLLWFEINRKPEDYLNY